MNWLATKIKGYRTFALNLLVLMISILTYLQSYSWSTITVDNAAYIVMGITIANIILRAITTSPMFQSEPTVTQVMAGAKQQVTGQ